MTRELQSTLQACWIEWLALRNHIPCMAHVIQLALCAFMSSLGVKGRTKSWEADERDQLFGENESMDTGNRQRLRKEGNARINKVSAMKPGLAKKIEKVRISWYFECCEADLHIAENACCINYTNTWSPKWSSLTVKKLKSALKYFLLWIWRHIGTLHWSCSSAPTDYGNSHTSGFYIQNTVNTGHCSQLRMNGWLSSMWWKYWGHFDIGPFGCRGGIQSHCITSSQCTMTCLITWMA